MTAHPHGLAGRSNASHVNRAVKFTTRDAQDPSPDVLCLIKREVDAFDQLEISSPSTWATNVAALPSKYQKMFQGGTYNRIRTRHLVYGFSAADLQDLLGNLLAINYTVTSWLRLSGSPTSGGNYTGVNEMLTANNIVQSVAGRRPAVATSTNGFPVATWNGANVLPWAVTAANNSTAAWFLAFWFKPTANVTTRQRMFFAGFPGATSKIMFDISAGGGFDVQFSKDGTNGKNLHPAANAVASTWQFARVQFDGSAGTDAAKFKYFSGEVDQGGVVTDVGTPGTMNSLNSSSGSYAIGALSDVDSPSTAVLNGFQTGPNIFVGSSVLSVAQGAALMNFEKPT